MKRFFLLCLMLFVLPASNVKADVALYDIDANPGAWAAAVAAMTSSTAWDFNLDPDYGITGFSGPLTSAGSAPVSPGIVAPYVSMNSFNLGGSTPELVGVGPVAGFGNPSNAVLANYFVDAFDVQLTGGVQAIQFNALSLIGSDTVDIYAYDNLLGFLYFGTFAAPAVGHNYGLLAYNGSTLDGFLVYDTSNGAEGVQGQGVAYFNAIPEPSSLAFLSLIGVAGVCFRRRK